VRELAVCDRWFASNPASTQPNRLFVHSATSHGLVSNDTKALVAGLPQRTIFDALHDEGFSFGIYYQYPPSTLFYRNLRQLKYAGSFHAFDLDFRRHCREGKLPSYVVVEQRYFDLKILPGNDDHPSHDVAEGQRFVKEVYEALRSGPQWEETLLVVTYDEHGGFYDHVPPRSANTGEPAPFDRLGVRVPALVVSPWVSPGRPHHGVLDHTCIARTALELFAPGNVDKLSARVSASRGLLDVLKEPSPRTDAVRLEGMPVVEQAVAPILQTEIVPPGFHSMELTENQHGLESLKREVTAAGVPSDMH